MRTPPAHDAREVLQDIADGDAPHPDMRWVVEWAIDSGLVNDGELTTDGRRHLRSVGGLP